MNKKEIQRLIAKSFDGTLTASEKIFLDGWLLESVENEKKYEEYTDLWKKTESLAFLDAIDVESSLLQTKKRIYRNRTKRKILFYTGRMAAVLILAIFLSFTFNYFVATDVTDSAKTEIVFQEVRAAYGTKTKLVLRDSTVVWLNSGSSLRFPISFEGLDERKVTLVGEAYFDVTKNANKPFIVHTKKLDVKVYGTAFNVNAYDDYDSMLVALVEGKVSLLQDRNDEQKELMMLRPNDVVTYNDDSKELSRSRDSRLEKYTAWKEGSILFYNDPIDFVIMRLEKWYNVEIHIEDEALKEYRFTATFTNESLEQVLDLLSLSSAMDYKIVEPEIKNNDDNGKRKILLQTKNN